MLHIPKISCVAVQDEGQNVEQAVRSFNNQTYPNKELILLSQVDGIEHDLGLVSAADDTRCFQVSKHKDFGTLRNLAVELATGELICLWDCNTISHPHRLATQYRELASGAVATGYCQYLEFHPSQKKLYWAVEEGLLLESLLFRKDCFFQYNGTLFNTLGIIDVSKVGTAGNITRISDGFQYLLIDSVELTPSAALGARELEFWLKPVFEMLQFAALDGPIEICSLEGRVIVYGT